MSYLALPCLLVVAAAYWISTARRQSDADITLRIASDLLERVNENALWYEAIGERTGILMLWRAALEMLRVVSNRPDLPKARNELVLMAFCLYVVTRWCLWVESPIKALFPSLHRRAAWTSARIYCSMAEIYESSIELEPC